MNRPLPFVLAASDHGPMIVNRLDFHQLPTGVSYGVGHQILTRGCYDSDEISSILNILSRLRDSCSNTGIFMVDCGANIGVFTVEIARHINSWGRVAAIEAQERLFYALCGNIAINNLFNAEAIFAAVGQENSIIEIPKPNYNKPASFGSLELRRSPATEYIGQNISYAKKDLVSVPLRRLDDLFAHESVVDFIKLDIEGMEIDALKGAQQVLTRFHPILWIEWIKSDRNELQQILESFGYYFIEERGANLLATYAE